MRATMTVALTVLLFIVAAALASAWPEAGNTGSTRVEKVNGDVTFTLRRRIEEERSASGNEGTSGNLDGDNKGEGEGGEEEGGEGEGGEEEGGDEEQNDDSKSDSEEEGDTKGEEGAAEGEVEERTKQHLRRYKILSSEDIYKQMSEMENVYPNFVTLKNAQVEYGLPLVGSDEDCSYEGGCHNWFFTIEDKISHPVGSGSWQVLPEVFLSGALHGNERVGPTAVMEAANILLEAASCEAKPRASGAPTGQNVKADDLTFWEEELIEAKACRKRLETEHGITTAQRKWLARLVTTRRIVIAPAANALGYFRSQREEDGIDPNRDFPYDLKDYSKCMQTIAARTINEIFREHMFQLSITFHGGMEAIGYEWGAPSYQKGRSPDDTAQEQIARGYSSYGDGWEHSHPYQTGQMNDVVYYVRGGMEDWAYAASWDSDHTRPCVPTTYGIYPPERTTYNNSTLRMFNMLVETSNRKTPTSSELGTTEKVLNADTPGNGHISRNIRLSLLAIELVEPYLSIVSVNGVPVTDDVVPQSARSDQSCRRTKVLSIPHGQNETVIEWTVGGGFTVDYTTVYHAKWSDVNEEIHCDTQPTEDQMGRVWKPVQAQTSGKTQWHSEGAEPAPSDESDPDLFGEGPIFRAVIDTSVYKAGASVAILATAQLDRDWATSSSNVDAVLPRGMEPTSHVVNARTNPKWHHESAGKIVQGRKDWYSMPLTLTIANNQDDRYVTKEIMDRLNGHGMATYGEDDLLKVDGIIKRTLQSPAFIIGVSSIILGYLLCAWYSHLKRRQRELEKLKPADLEEDEQARRGITGESYYGDTEENDEAREDIMGNDGLELKQYKVT